jgi:hypothetical protein
MPINDERLAADIAKAEKSKPSLNQLETILETLRELNVLALPSVPFQFKQHLPKATAVYLAYIEDTVLYVGQSVDVHTRWANHEVAEKIALHQDLPSNPDLRIGWVECPNHLLDFVEIYLIGLLQPVLNIRHRG